MNDGTSVITGAASLPNNVVAASPLYNNSKEIPLPPFCKTYSSVGIDKRPDKSICAVSNSSNKSTLNDIIILCKSWSLLNNTSNEAYAPCLFLK